MDKITERKIKLLLTFKTEDRKIFEKNNHCFIGVWNGYENDIDYFSKITNDNHIISWDDLNSKYDSYGMRARMQLGYVFAVWLPNIISKKLENIKNINIFKDIIIKNHLKLS